MEFNNNIIEKIKVIIYRTKNNLLKWIRDDLDNDTVIYTVCKDSYKLSMRITEDVFSKKLKYIFVIETINNETIFLINSFIDNEYDEILTELLKEIKTKKPENSDLIFEVLHSFSVGKK